MRVIFELFSCGKTISFFRQYKKGARIHPGAFAVLQFHVFKGILYTVKWSRAEDQQAALEPVALRPVLLGSFPFSDIPCVVAKSSAFFGETILYHESYFLVIYLWCDDKFFRRCCPPDRR